MRRKKSVLFSTICMFVIIFFIFSILLGVIALISYQAINASLNNSNQNFIGTVQTQIDQLFLQTEVIAQDLCRDDNIIDLAKHEHSDFSVNFELLNKIKNKYSAFTKIKTYLYFKNTDHIISSVGTFSAVEYYNTFCTNDFESFDEWKKYILSTDYDWHPYTSSAAPNAAEQGGIRRIYQIPLNDSKVRNHLVVFFEIDSKDIFRNIQVKSFENLQIRNNNHDLIAGVNNKYDLQNIFNGTEPPKHYDMYHTKSGHEKLLVAYSPSGICGCYYLYIIPYAYYFHAISSLMTLMYISIALALILTAVSLIYLYKKNMMPLEKLVAIFQETDTIEDVNEYVFLDNKIHELSNHVDDMRTENIKNMLILKETLLKNLLCTDLSNDYTLVQRLEKYGIVFKYDFFAILLIKAVFPLNEESASRYSRILEASMEKHFVCKCNFYTTHINDTIAIIINFDYNRKRYDIIEAINQAKTDFLNENHIDIYLTLSNIFEALPMFQTSYRSASDAMEYAVKNELLFVAESNITNDYHYSPAVEQELMNSLEAGNAKACCALIEQLYKDNIANRQLSRSGRNQLILKINVTLERFTNVCLPDQHRIFDIKDFLNEDAEKIFHALKEIFKETAEQHLLKQIEQYIEINYANAELNLNYLAEIFGFDPVYLSNMYRQHTGNKITTRINQKRINVARRMLLSDQEMTLEDISRCVGYSNTRTFLRNFQQIEGLTPTNFRLQYTSE